MTNDYHLSTDNDTRHTEQHTAKLDHRLTPFLGRHFPRHGPARVVGDGPINVRVLALAIVSHQSFFPPCTSNTLKNIRCAGVQWTCSPPLPGWSRNRKSREEGERWRGRSLFGSKSAASGVIVVGVDVDVDFGERNARSNVTVTDSRVCVHEYGYSSSTPL